MNIAYIVYRFPCISESFIMDQITGMLDRKQNVTIFANAGRTRDPVHPQVDAYGLMERTRLLPRVAKSRQRLLRQAGKAVLAKPGLIANSPGAGNSGWKEKIRSLAKFHGFVWPKAPKFDIVHCQFGCVARTYWASKKLWDARLVVSFRGHDFSSLPRRFGPGMYKELFQAVDAVMVVCNYAATKLLYLGCPPEKLVTHYSGTDLSDFAFKARTLEAGATVRILTVCRLEESKGLEYALQAVSTLIHKHKLNVRYGIVGDGSLRSELERLADSLGLREHVEFFGSQARPQVRELMHEHHVFLLPSVTSSDGGQEGIPGSVREAMATGMPVVSTLHSGIPELVTDGVSGFLVPERDSDALAARLHQLVTTPDSWATMGRQGRAHVERNFDIIKLNRRLEAFYHHVLTGRNPAEFDSEYCQAQRAA